METTEMTQTKKIGLIIAVSMIAVLSTAGIVVPEARTYIIDAAKIILGIIPDLLR